VPSEKGKSQRRLTPPLESNRQIDSVVFAKNLIGDIRGLPELANCHIALMYIDAERMTHKVAAPARSPLVEPLRHKQKSRQAYTQRLSLKQRIKSTKGQLIDLSSERRRGRKAPRVPYRAVSVEIPLAS
jgi:hypothetical protein